MYFNLILLAYALTTSAGLVLLKLGGKEAPPIAFVNGKIELNLGFYVVGGILLYGISFLIYTYLISKNELGYIIPVSTALVYVFIFIASFLIFKELVTALKIIGICLIIGGVILLNWNGR